MRPDKGKPYYSAYDKRYRAVYAQGADHYLYLPEHEAIKETIKEFVNKFALNNKRVVELGCGEGFGGLELAKLGCIYQGYDIAPAAIEKARVLMLPYPNAQVTVFDVVQEALPQATFDAGVDVACRHMLVTDVDRYKYLRNVFTCLKQGSPMLFAHEILCDVEYQGEVNSYEQWLTISGDDVDTPIARTAIKNGEVISVSIPLIAARARTVEGYQDELKKHGFMILELTKHQKMVNIWVSKP
jgi:SAM-dependent methyltransferase